MSIIGKKFVKKSLGVADLKTATKLRNAYTVQIDAEFEAAEQMMSEADTTPAAAAISLSALTEFVRQYMAQENEKSSAHLLVDPPEDQEQLSEMRKEVEIAMTMLKRPGNPNGEHWIQSTGKIILTAQSASLEDKELVAGFAELVRRGLLELQRLKIDRLDYEYNSQFHDPLFDPKRAPSLTFGELIDIFWAERSEEYRENTISPKRVDMVKAALEFLREAVGADTPLSSVADDTVQHVRSILARLPPNRKKIYPKLSLSKAIEKAQKEGRKPLNPVTQKQYLVALRDVLAVGLRKRLIGHNPASNVKPIKKPTLSASEKKLPWSDDQIVGFFTGVILSDLPTRCVNSIHKNRPGVAVPHRPSTRSP